MDIKWHIRFLKLAEQIATWSKDPSTKVGAIIVDGNRIVSTGYNGFPSDFISQYSLISREEKLAKTIHAEVNAILYAKRDLTNCSIVITAPPCSNCAAVIAQTGIKEVICNEASKELAIRWKDSFRIAQDIFDYKGIKLIKYTNHRTSK